MPATGQSTRVVLGILLGGWSVSASASAVEDARSLFDSVPAPPATVAAAGAATQIVSAGGTTLLAAPAYAAIETKLKTQLAAAATPGGTAAGIDFARMQSDPAYAAQIQTRIQSMSPSEKMAFAQQMSASRPTSGAGTGAVAAFIGGQRAADQVAQSKMRTALEAALQAAGARHKDLDAQLATQAKACPTDKTGWPESACTSALGQKSIAQHRAIEETALVQESKAYATARAAAEAEVAKARTVAAQADGNAAASLAAWIDTYTELLREYGEAITVRAGFWAHADASKYTGNVSIYVGDPDHGITWPLAHPNAAHVGL